MEETPSTAPRSDLLALISAKNGNPPAGTSEDGGETALSVGLMFFESRPIVGVGGGGGACGGLLTCVGRDAEGKGGADTLGREILELFLWWLLCAGLTEGICGLFCGTFGAEAPDNGSGGAGDDGTMGIGGAAEDGISGIGGAEDEGILGTAGAGDNGALGMGGAATDGTAPGIGGALADGEGLVLALLLICFNFGIPPAKISPNCGAPIPGIGGADIEGPLLLTVPELPEADETTPPPTIGALLSLVSAFFSFIPFLMSPNRASRPCITDFAGLGALPPNAGGGGGGGGAGAPAISTIRYIYGRLLQQTVVRFLVVCFVSYQKLSS